MGRIWLISVAAVVAAVMVVGVLVIRSVQTVGSSTGTVTITIDRGMGLRAVAQRLFTNDLLKNRQAWVLYAWLTGRREAILAGTYEIAPGQTGKQILELLTLGGNSREVTVTVPEGWRLTQIARILSEKGVVAADDFLAAARHPTDLVGDWSTDLFQSKPASVDLEGYLFPDTYRFFRDSAPDAVIRRMSETLDARLDDGLRRKISMSGHSLHQVLTLASILELELRTPNDRAMAADLFWRRLAADMPLQSDATVNYVTGKMLAQPTNADTRVESPYNTYLHVGLPPGPISSPGLDAIGAAVTPQPNDYWYYLSKPTGETVFSRTYEEHLRNKERYLR